MYPTRRAVLPQQICRINQLADSDSARFFDVLSGPALSDQMASLVPQHRERLFPPLETLSMFLAQVLSEDRSCQNTVNKAAVQRLSNGLPACSTDTGAYCRARKRLPLELVSTLTRFSGTQIAKASLVGWRWQGRAVRMVDGTTISMPDTLDNQRVFPQPGSQAPGLGFPQCRLVGITCLASGAILDAALGPCQGKGSDEQALLRRLLDTLEPGNLLLGDALYATYFLLCALQARGVDGVFEQHGSRQRSTDFRRGRRLGPRDHLIVLSKPKKKPEWMSEAAFDQAPESLTVRELRVGGKVLVTTLLCAKTTGKSALKKLYWSRWHVELDLRSIKTTLGMDILSCKTAAMVEKELWVYLLAYNLIRLMMAEAAYLAGILPRQVSFKHTLQLWNAWIDQALETSPAPVSVLLELIAQQQVGNRGGRIEPRAVKRRPKSFPRLTRSRSEARAEVQKYGHPRKS